MRFDVHPTTMKQKQGASLRTHPEKSTYDRDMYNRAFPVGNALFFFAGGVMSLLCLPCGKFSLAFLAVPAGKDGRVECPCQTVDDFIGVGGSVCRLFLFVQTHTPLTIRRQFIRTKKKRHTNVCSPVDIPTGWEPRTKQQPTGLIAYPAAQGRAVQVLLSAQKKKRHTNVCLFLVRIRGLEPPPSCPD